ncbi:protein slit-like [Bacillus rossius redtenbacheri]|uniref:protein slit-like n=1 Tax=Bacillus rossius redtenbacheri TaxID=93214 RepID=UPI002FDCFCDE
MLSSVALLALGEVSACRCAVASSVSAVAGGGVAGLEMLLAILSFAFLQQQVVAQIRPGCNVIRGSDDIVATCDRLSLQEVPPDLPRNITMLSFRFNQLTRLTGQLITNDCGLTHNTSLWCSRFPNMTYLDFSYNTIELISLYSFSGMVFLSTIDLGNNKIEDLPSIIFSSNRFLVYIDVSGNNIKFVHPDVFKNLQYLRVLYISNNHIVDIQPETFDGLLSLDSLFLNNNSISRLNPELFKNLSNLQYFLVAHNRLECIAQGVMYQLPNLRLFTANHNQITFLSPALFTNNKNLRIVDFSHNLIRELSKYTFLQFIKMYQVNLSFNRLEWLYLSYLPVSFISHYNIVQFDMDTDICLDKIGTKNPCFVNSEKNMRKEVFFHSLDFSHNNIKTIKYIVTKMFHSLELANISFAGNYGLNLEVSFFRKERFFTIINLDGTNLNWKNLTLINEMLELPLLKMLSVVGSGVCEFYTKQLLNDVFNPNKRVNVICDGPMTEYFNTNTRMLRNTSISISIEERNRVGIIDSTDNDNNTQCLEESSSYNTRGFCSFECECYAFSLVQVKKFIEFTTNNFCPSIQDCSYYSFTVLPELKSNFKCMLFSHNSVNNIEDEYFKLFYDVEYLDLSHNCLNDLSDKVVNPLTSLTALYLDNNNLASLKPGVFKHLSKLKVLTLHGNSISSYDANVFAGTLLLSMISIDFANLDNLHDATFQKLSTLTFLHLRENTKQLVHKNILKTEVLKKNCVLYSLHLVGFNLSESLNSSILCSNYLKFIVLEGNYLPVLTDNIFRGVSGIASIIFPNNGIRILGHDTFRNLTKVIFIDLSVNSIKVLHTSMFSDMQQLKFLNVSHNKISCIFAAMFQNSFLLESLDISHNRIVVMDSKFFRMLYNLLFLFLNDNNITVVGEKHWLNEYKISCNNSFVLGNTQAININITDIESVPQRKQSIEVIKLSNNALELLDDSMFKHNRLLKRITASYNSIHQINNGTFNNTRDLRTLELNHNELVVINASLFKNLARLQFLALHRNRIEFIEKDTFQDLIALETLILSNNRLKTFDATSLPISVKMIKLDHNDIIISNSSALNLKSLERFYLSYNPLKNIIVDYLIYLPSLVYLDIVQTNVHEFSTEAFKNTATLAFLNLARSCVHSLSGRHFHNLPGLLVLDMSRPRTRGCAPGTDNVLSWKNITLINSWFEHPFIQYMILTGHDICEDMYWNQVIDNIFLSEKWKLVFCSEEYELPTLVLSVDAKWALSLLKFSI